MLGFSPLSSAPLSSITTTIYKIECDNGLYLTSLHNTKANLSSNILSGSYSVVIPNSLINRSTVLENKVEYILFSNINTETQIPLESYVYNLNGIDTKLLSDRLINSGTSNYILENRSILVNRETNLRDLIYNLSYLPTGLLSNRLIDAKYNNYNLDLTTSILLKNSILDSNLGNYDFSYSPIGLIKNSIFNSDYNNFVLDSKQNYLYYNRLINSYPENYDLSYNILTSYIDFTRSGNFIISGLSTELIAKLQSYNVNTDYIVFHRNRNKNIKYIF